LSSVSRSIRFMCNSLRLQDLTRRDIDHYVSHKMHSSTSFKSLFAKEPQAASALIQEVVYKADGVFLWVKIVVKSLLNGIRNRDGLQDLHQRLDLLPKELEPLYTHLLSLIESIYYEWASKAFQLVRAVRNHRNYLSAPGEVAQPLSILQLYLAINQELNFHNLPRHNSQPLSSCYEDTQIQLTARCGGFLEVHTYKSELVGAYTGIRYLHRTAKDFIEESGNIWDRFLGYTARTPFNAATSMLHSNVLLLAQRSRDEG
jgi:hypothetical protein